MKKKFVGFYNPSVILTYVSLCFSIISMSMAFHNRIKAAVFFLMVSGLCDMFDGTVARRCKRTEEEKKFGIQIDSLCDMVCFGVTPGVIGIFLFPGYGEVIGILTTIALSLCGLIRLAYFNVTEELRQEETSERRSYYEGLPITCSAIAAPLAFIGGSLLSHINELLLPLFYCGFLWVIAFLYVYNFPVKKVHGRGSYVMIACCLGLFIGVLLV